MNTGEKALSRVSIPERRIDAAGSLRTGFSRTLSWFDGMLLGGATPRGYRREGFPEIELHQIISGRHDRFEGL
jgi:hypothetical protein